MNYKPDRHHRRSIRLKEYDYSQAGAYFVTVCTQKRECFFGEIVDGEMQLNNAGQMVQDVWNNLVARYPDIETDEFIVMPNHLHGIVVFVEASLVGALPLDTVDHGIGNRAGTRPAPTNIT